MSKPFLYDAVDTLYNGLMNHMPQALQDRDMTSAAVLGAVGTYGVIRGSQWTSKNVMNKLIPNFDEKWLPILEKICIAGMSVAPVVYAGFDPNGAKEIMTQHPTYTSGMLGVLAGSLTGAVQDLYKRSKQKALEEKLS